MKSLTQTASEMHAIWSILPLVWQGCKEREGRKKGLGGSNLISHDLFQLNHTYCWRAPLAVKFQNICRSWASAQTRCNCAAALNKAINGVWLLTLESELLDVMCYWSRVCNVHAWRHFYRREVHSLSFHRNIVKWKAWPQLLASGPASQPGRDGTSLTDWLILQTFSWQWDKKNKKKNLHVKKNMRIFSLRGHSLYEITSDIHLKEAHFKVCGLWVCSLVCSLPCRVGTYYSVGSSSYATLSNRYTSHEMKRWLLSENFFNASRT